jgi:dienelactone hydrolase
MVQLAALLVSLLGLTSCASFSRPGNVGPWDVESLSRSPAVTWGATTGRVQELYYEGEPFNGRPTRVFAYLARPETQSVTRLPAMVLVHGGGGKAFKDLAEHWARRGYVALAMDLSGNGPAGRLPDGGPDQSDPTKFRNFSADEAREMWTYHAVAAVLRGHSLVRSLPEVDAQRVGITGISWGGYLTCIAAGIDRRFKVAVPVYGCGFLGDNSVWKDGALSKMTPEARELWLKLFDPGQYLGRVRCPILFMNGTTDFAYPLDSYQKSYRLVPAGLRHVSVAVNRPHGHIWTFPEVDAFASSVLRDEPPLVRMGRPVVKAGILSAELDRVGPLQEVSLCYTTNSGPWQKRSWHIVPANVSGRNIAAKLPPARPLVAFISVKDERGHISSEHVELGE